MNQGTQSDFKKADQELNRVYRKILQKYKDSPQFISKLREAQRAWLKFRDAQLEAKFPLPDKQREYGTAYPMCADEYLAELTKGRIKELQEWLEGAEEGDVCSGSVKFN